MATAAVMIRVLTIFMVLGFMWSLVLIKTKLAVHFDKPECGLFEKLEKNLRSADEFRFCKGCDKAVVDKMRGASWLVEPCAEAGGYGFVEIDQLGFGTTKSGMDVQAPEEKKEGYQEWQNFK